ncbi:unnamed protein product [Urochloa humidicola]
MRHGPIPMFFFLSSLSLNCSQPSSHPPPLSFSLHRLALLLSFRPPPQPLQLFFNSPFHPSLFNSFELGSINSLTPFDPSSPHCIPFRRSIHPPPKKKRKMGKKKGLVSIFSRLIVDSSPAAGPATPPWPWPPCGTNPPTASFRGGACEDDDEPCCTTAAPGEMYKTVNSVYNLDDPAADADLFSLAGDDEEESSVLADDADSFSTTTASEEWSEAVIRSLGRTSTDRFFFDPGPLPASNSILATAAAAEPAAEAKTTKTTVTPPPEPDDGDARTALTKSVAEGSVAVAVDSGDPYGDFRASMEEMVAAHGLRDWAALEELLACYLRINGKHHHHLIVGAFVDLLLGLSSSAETSTSSSSSGSRCCTTSTSTSTAPTTTTSAGDAATASAATTTATPEEREQCGGGNEEAHGCCSSSSSCAAAGPDVQDDVADEDGEDEKASGASTGGGDRARAAASAPLPLRLPQSIA